MVARTQKAIVEAFNTLIYKYDFEKISVDMIIREADISRSTFYRYFRDKYEVMNVNYKNLLDYYVSPKRCKNYRDLYYHLFKTAQESWKYLENAFSSTGINSFSNYIYEYSYEAALSITKTNRGGRGFTPTEELQFDVFCYGVSEMYKHWIFGKYTISASEAADALYEMMPESLKHYWWNQ